MTAAFIFVTIAAVCFAIVGFISIRRAGEAETQALRLEEVLEDTENGRKRIVLGVESMVHVAFQAVKSDDVEIWKQGLVNSLNVAKMVLTEAGHSEADWEAVLESTPEPPRVRRRYSNAPSATVAVEAGLESPTQGFGLAEDPEARTLAETEGIDPEGQA